MRGRVRTPTRPRSASIIGVAGHLPYTPSSITAADSSSAPTAATTSTKAFLALTCCLICWRRLETLLS
jgi:hypothetical protein